MLEKLTPQPQRPYVGVHLLLIRDGQLLLMKRTVKDEMDGLYALVAGKVDLNESPSVALVREAYEEVGVMIDPKDLRHVLTIHHAKTEYKADLHDIIEFYFTTDHWSGEPHLMEPELASELKFFPLDKLPEPLSPWIKYALKAYQSGGPGFIEL